MRLIDADAYAYPGDLVDEPTVDAVEVVRCKDCKAAKQPDNYIQRGKVIVCGVYSSHPIMRCNDYCSYGERKEEE